MSKGYTTLVVAVATCMIAGSLIAKGGNDKGEKGENRDKGQLQEHREEMDKQMSNDDPVAACKAMLENMEKRHKEMASRGEERYKEMLEKMKQKHEEMQKQHEEEYKERVELLKDLISKGDELTKEDVRAAMKEQSEKMRERHQKRMEERKKNCDREGQGKKGDNGEQKRNRKEKSGQDAE